MRDLQSQAHVKHYCKYHIIFVPKYRKKLLYGALRKDIGYIAGIVPPPFRELTQDEQTEFLKTINESGAKILFLGLGCPKQERWMAHNEEKINAIMIGVGAAFDFYAGTKKMAPLWMVKLGLEWLYRLGTEPGRLWERYLMLNPRFIFHFTVAWLTQCINNLRSKLYRRAHKQHAFY